jgi:DNA-directed RNA polymerase subunit alpha
VGILERVTEKYKDSEIEITNMNVNKGEDRTRINFVLSHKKGGKLTGIRIHIDDEKNVDSLIYNYSNDPKNNEAREVTEKVGLLIRDYFIHESIYRLNFITGVGEYEHQVIVEPIYGLPIDVMDLSPRAYNCLSREGFRTVGSVAELSFLELSSIAQMGQKSVLEVKYEMEKFGINLK